MYAVGQKVLHADFGEGTVKNVGTDGALLKVYFDAIQTVVPVPTASVTATTPPPLPPEPSPAPVQARDEAPSLDYRRLTIECLRQGLPPPGKLTSWTFGHARARKIIDAAIANAVRGEGSVLYASAGYGKGKSHVGRLGRELAREHGLASFHVELDGSAISLSDGTRLVASLFASARLPEADGDKEHLVPGLATILKRAAPFAALRFPRDLDIFSPFLRNPQRWVESEEVIVVLEEYLSGYVNRIDSEEALRKLLGDRIPLESMKMDYGATEDRQKRQADQLRRIVRLAMMAGAKGAFVVIDEFDHDYQTGYGVERKNAMLSQLVRVATKEPIVLLLLARNLEFEISGAQELALQELSETEQQQLVEKVIDAFSAVYPSPALTAGRNELFEAIAKKYRKDYRESGWGPRFFVRATIECCEATRCKHLESLAQVAI